jgi:hypothetical protein
LILIASRSIEFLALTVMAALLPLSPVVSTLISGDLQYVRRYGHTLDVCARMIAALWNAHVISRNLGRVLAFGARAPGSIQGRCTHCGRCCIQRSCVFLRWDDAGRSSCSIYNNWFWKLTSCGSYPVDALSIEVYQCPSFSAIPIKLVRQTIRP